MFQQDYILRIISEMIRFMFRLLFGGDIPAEPLTYREYDSLLARMLDLAEEGKIDEAENLLFDSLDPDDERTAKNALLFYDYLNRKSDAFLREHGFEREEILTGLRDALRYCGKDHLMELFDSERR